MQSREMICYSQTDKEFNSLMNSDIDKRVKHFKNMVGGHRYFWLCLDKNGNLFANYDAQNRECISVWPAKEYAERVLSIDDYRLLSIEIHSFLKNI